MISIVIPVYNSMDYIGECLDSLEKQQDSVFEIVLVDDGSTDGSGEYCDNYAYNKENVKVIHQKNRGQQAARAEGVRRSAGDYIMFLDSDDCLRQDALRIISETFRHGAYDVVCFDYSRGNRQNYETGVLGGGLLQPGDYSGERYKEVLRTLCSGQFNNLVTKAIRRNLAIEALSTLEGNAGLRHGEDLMYLIPVISNARSLCCLPDVLYFYRDNPSSVTGAFSSFQIGDLGVVFTSLVRKAAIWGGDCPLIAKNASVKHFFWALMSLSKSGLPDYRKVGYAREIAEEVRSVCGNDAGSIVTSMRLDFAIPMKLLMSGRSRLALMCASLICSLTNVRK